MVSSFESWSGIFSTRFLFLDKLEEDRTNSKLLTDQHYWVDAGGPVGVGTQPALKRVVLSLLILAAGYYLLSTMLAIDETDVQKLASYRCAYNATMVSWQKGIVGGSYPQIVRVESFHHAEMRHDNPRILSLGDLSWLLWDKDFSPQFWWSRLRVLFLDLWLRLGDENGTLQMDTDGLWGCSYTSGRYDVVVSRDVSTLSGGVLRY